MSRVTHMNESCHTYEYAQAPADDKIDEVNVAIASQRADGYSNGNGAAVDDVSLPEDE